VLLVLVVVVVVDAVFGFAATRQQVISSYGTDILIVTSVQKRNDGSWVIASSVMSVLTLVLSLVLYVSLAIVAIQLL